MNRYTNSTVNISYTPFIFWFPHSSIDTVITDYRFEYDRFQSFVMWPYRDWIKPEKLAEAGFYYIEGNHHLVRCFVCCCTIPAFDLSEKSELDHLKYSPKCNFMINYLFRMRFNDSVLRRRSL